MIIYLNGKYLEKGSACLSPDERGFLLGDGLYEVMLCYNGQPFCLNEHLARLKRGCDFIRLNIVDLGFIKQVCATLIEKNNLGNSISSLYIQVTRGAAPRSHKFPPPQVPPTIYIAVSEFAPQRRHQQDGIAVILRDDLRWERCDIKTIDLLPNVLAHQEALEQGGQEALFVRDDILLEGTHSNFFSVVGGILRTHPLTNKILPGITRQKVLEICAAKKIKYVEQPVDRALIRKTEEAFITSTTLEITPVIKIDHLTIADGVPGPLTRRISEEYQKLIKGKGDGF